MSGWPWLRSDERKLEPRLHVALQAYRAREEPNLRLPHAAGRMVVVDVETSGLDPRRDRLLSIGAVAVSGGLVRLDQGFESVLRQPQPSGHPNILLHGIAGSRQIAGREPASALLDFLAFAGKDPLVAFNAAFDRIMIERAARATLGIKPANAWLDLALLLPALLPRDAAVARTLDEWTDRLGIAHYTRHDAVSDALATAQLLLVGLARAREQGIENCAHLISLQRNRHWLGG